ncbi:hypothetical protein PAN31117_04529 [Pandoraea anapnoica]|uniref:Uncharacterized protein n=1 Tax=Pandoraea anapnoica TaxID=2508301 RepID=A0A5E5AGK5_9BURK|nr:hypothetical protein PAN31117_04529 [Pandoraea anapnoica]
MSHISSARNIVDTFVMPMLLDFWMTPAAVSVPFALSSLIVAPSKT